MERLVQTQKTVYPTKRAIEKGKTYMEMIMPDLLKAQARAEIAVELKKMS